MFRPVAVTLQVTVCVFRHTGPEQGVFQGNDGRVKARIGLDGG